MVDSANTAQISSSCIQLLSVLSAESLQNAPVLILFNKRDMPCIMSLIETKSLFRMDDIIASATQPITVLEMSARSGEGLKEVMSWLESVAVKWCFPNKVLKNVFKPSVHLHQYFPLRKGSHTVFKGFNSVLSVGQYNTVAKNVTNGTLWKMMTVSLGD